jgi:hypothetical protein
MQSASFGEISFMVDSWFRACLKKRTDWFGGSAVKEKRIKCLI